MAAMHFLPRTLLTGRQKQNLNRPRYGQPSPAQGIFPFSGRSFLVNRLVIPRRHSTKVATQLVDVLYRIC
jgi:hypothetical protein